MLYEVITHVLARNNTQGGSVESRVRDAAKEVARPVAFAVAIIVLVYVPILSLQGIEGKMFLVISAGEHVRNNFV